MSIAPIAPIGPTAMALRVQAIGAVESELMQALDSVQGAAPADRPEAAQTDPAPAPRTPAPTPTSVRQAIDAALAEAAGRQAGAAPLFADLAEAQGAPDLSATVKAAIGQLLALRTPLSGPMTAATIREAVAQSGLFLEAHLLRAAPGEAAPPDMKAALLTLQRALGDNAPIPAHPTATPPPLRNAALVAQPAAPITLSAQDGAAAIGQHLSREIDQAVARQVLHQLASLPDGATPAWMFELPLLTPQGTAMAQFEIDRDGRQAGAEGATETWRARFSLDIEPLGPVHVHLRMGNAGAAVTVWAERAEGLERLRSLGGELAHALPAEVVFRAGAPQAPPPASGQFVDRSS